MDRLTKILKLATAALLFFHAGAQVYKTVQKMIAEERAEAESPAQLLTRVAKTVRANAEAGDAESAASFEQAFDRAEEAARHGVHH